MRKCAVLLALLLLLAACGDGEAGQEEIPAALPELEETAWQALSTGEAVSELEGGFENPNFEFVFSNVETVPLEQLAAFSLVADGAAGESALDELRSRFLEAPNTVLLYLALLGDEETELKGWEPAPTAELLCGFIASADAAWYEDSEEFFKTLAACRRSYPEGRIAELLDVMEERRAADR